MKPFDLLALVVAVTATTVSAQTPPATPASSPSAPAASAAAPPAAPAAVPSAVAANDPRVELFVAKCSSCHTVGKGPRVGPDLKGVAARRDAAWLPRFVQAPSGMLDADPTARQLLTEWKGVRMPDLGLSGEQVGSLLQLIATCTEAPCDLAGKLVPVTTATPADIAHGRELFMGRVALAKGGVACQSCHTVQGIGSAVPGGTLAKDLTNAFARLGDEGLDAALKNPTFLVMNKVFVDHPLESGEVFALRAFLWDANRKPPKRDEVWSVLLVALLGAGGGLAALDALWRRRLRGVRSSVTGRKGKHS